jgi:hypothetical protein
MRARGASIVVACRRPGDTLGGLLQALPGAHVRGGERPERAPKASPEKAWGVRAVAHALGVTLF